MSESQMAHHDQPLIYEVILKGHLREDWNDWLGGVTVKLQADGTTMLTCQVADQAALHGLLRQIRDIGIPLISIKQIET